MPSEGVHNDVGPRPLISIVTVTLNAGEALRRTLQSVGSQSFSSYEHVIKDGGSTDGTLDDLEGPRRRVVTALDSGIYDAMNQAVDVCRGEYILFLNAGDSFMGPDSLAEFAAGAETGSDVIYCDVWHEGIGGRVLSPSRVTPFFLFRNTLCHQACLVRRSLFARLGRFDTTLDISADHEFLARAVLRGGASTLHVPVVGVRFQGGGVSARRRGALALQFREVRRRHFTPVRRAGYGALYLLTAPGLRSRLLAEDLACVRELYLWARNVFYGRAARQGRR